MARRPPQRVQTRHDDGGAALDIGAFAQAEAPSPSSSERPAVANVEADGRALPLSRQEFVESLGELRAQGALDVADEAAVLRQYDMLLADLKVEKTRLEAEFRERTDREGLEAAQAWLTEAAQALGRREGTRMRQLFQTIPALSAPVAPA